MELSATLIEKINLLMEETTDALKAKGHPEHMVVAPEISVYRHNGELFMLKIEERGDVWIMTMTIKGFGETERLSVFPTEEEAIAALASIQDNKHLNDDGSINFCAIFDPGLDGAVEAGESWEDPVSDDEDCDDDYEEEWDDD